MTNTSQVSEDPCAAGATNPAPLAQCLRTGITAAQYGVIPQCPSGQCAVLNGGNPALAPETAETFSVGVTAQPALIRGFTASVDYFRVDLKQVIGAIPLGVILNRCLASGDPQFCSQIVRASNGILFGATAGATPCGLTGTPLGTPPSRSLGATSQGPRTSRTPTSPPSAAAAGTPSTLACPSGAMSTFRRSGGSARISACAPG